MASAVAHGTRRVTKFSYERPQYDQSTFLGRLKTTFQISDPRTLRYSKAEVQEFDRILQDQRTGLSSVVYSDHDLWHMKTVCDSALHPQTHSVVGRLWRMSSFALTNMPIVAGFALSPPTFAYTVLWQSVNQTYNAFFNYSNRNTSNDAMSGRSQVLRSYLLALGVSVTTALSLNRLTKSSFLVYPASLVLQKVVPFIAVASAGMANVALMRSMDMLYRERLASPLARKGLDVKDESGHSYGRSKIAGRKVLGNVMLSRVVLPVPSLLIPPALIYLMRNIRKALNPKILLLSDLALAYVCCSVAMPIAMAVFPNQIRLDPAKLEPEFAQLTGADGQPLSVLYADKGL